MEDKMDNYIKILETWSGELEDLCYELYSMLMKENAEKRIQCFQFICEKIGEVDSDESVKVERYFAEGEVDSLKELYGKYVDEAINSVRRKVVSQKLSVHEFYALLWNTVFSDSLLTLEKERVFGLLWIVADNGIPYYELGTPLSMENDEYKRIIEENKKSSERISSILSIPLEQRTETSSLILKELSGKDEVTQAVLLAQAFAINSKREMKGFTQVIQALQEEREKK